MNCQELGLFALDFIDDLKNDDVTEDHEIINAVFMVAHRGEDSVVGYAYRAMVSDEAENVSLLLDVLKAELQQA